MRDPYGREVRASDPRPLDAFETLVLDELDRAYERRAREVTCEDCDLIMLPYTDHRVGVWWCTICGATKNVRWPHRA